MFETNHTSIHGPALVPTLYLTDLWVRLLGSGFISTELGGIWQRSALLSWSRKSPVSGQEKIVDHLFFSQTK